MISNNLSLKFSITALIAFVFSLFTVGSNVYYVFMSLGWILLIIGLFILYFDEIKAFFKKITKNKRKM